MLAFSSKIKHKIFAIKSAIDFNEVALEIFHFQAQNNKVYHKYLTLINCKVEEVKRVDQIPFLPIQFFKSFSVVIKNQNSQKVFKSSGTTDTGRSNHFVSDLGIYETSFTKGFNHFYGDIKDYVVLALLPSYLEQGESSLVYMVDKLITLSNNVESGYCLDDLKETAKIIKRLSKQKKKVLLIGVSYALLDLIEENTFELSGHFVIMETGGMKGRRRELTKKELHRQLKNGFGVNTIHSEYGMTELLSQAYSTGGTQFHTPPWMKVYIRDINDPLNFQTKNKSGGINIIDLANINSCSFIATQDLGRVDLQRNTFEILGRFDNSDVRGCNLLIAE